MKISDAFKKIIYSEGVNPLPATAMAVLYVLLLLYAMTITMVFSYLPKLVKFFGISEVDTGTYAGYIASGMFIGHTFSSLFWGYISDIKGKKTAALLSAVGLMLSTLAFAFSFNYNWALITRFVQGCFMGLLVVSKSILGDVCDDTNIALGISIVFSSYMTGLILGPSIGGFLAFPAHQYPHLFNEDSFFGRFVILIPNLLLVVGYVLIITIAIFHLPENKIVKTCEESYLLSSSSQKKRYIEESVDSDDYSHYSIEKENESKQDTRDKNKVTSFKILEPAYDESKAKSCSFFTKKGFGSSQIGKLLQIKQFMFICVLYCTCSVVVIGFDEMYPVFAATAVEFNGLGFSTANIGTVLLISSGFVLIAMLVFLPRITRRYGATKVFIWSMVTQAMVFPMVPAAAAIQNRMLLWAVNIFLNTVYRVAAAGSMITVNVLLNNSVSSVLLGTANGFGMTCACVGRSFAPSMFGSIYSWSLRNIHTEEENMSGFPINQYFVFFTQSAIAVLAAIFARRFIKSVDSKQVTSEVNTRVTVQNKHITNMTVTTFKWM